MEQKKDEGINHLPRFYLDLTTPLSEKIKYAAKAEERKYNSGSNEVYK
tara:strand:+ start:242 stop:385 length:144 start_codon:yes stop_codon:yes gene_type:complete